LGTQRDAEWIEKHMEEADAKRAKADRVVEVRNMIRDNLKLEALSIYLFLGEKLEPLERFCKLLPALKHLDLSGLTILIEKADSEMRVDEEGCIHIPAYFELCGCFVFIFQVNHFQRITQQNHNGCAEDGVFVLLSVFMKGILFESLTCIT
jgi:hypothetical protein